MKEKLYDLYTCFKLSLKIFLIPIIIGSLIGIISGLRGDGIDIVVILNWIFSVGVWVASLGLGISVVGMWKKSFFTDLNYQKRWRVYFYKLNLVGVICAISFFMMAYVVIIDLIRFAIK